MRAAVASSVTPLNALSRREFICGGWSLCAEKGSHQPGPSRCEARLASRDASFHRESWKAIGPPDLEPIGRGIRGSK
jgi:hypothetical protein